MKLPSSIQFIERDWLSANHILFCDNGSVTVMDTGYKKHASMTQQLIEQACQRFSLAASQGQPACRLTTIINTHLHSDHCGGNARLQQNFSGLNTLIPIHCADAVSQWDHSELTYTDTAQECDPFIFTHTYQDNDQRVLGGFEWRALGAPGHDHTMLLWYCKELKLLISGDALWSNGFGIIFPELEGKSGFSEQAATLNRLEALEVDWVIPGHGPAFNDFSEALGRAKTKLTYLQSNPDKHVLLAGKVLLKFMLLDRESIDLRDLPALLSMTRPFKQLAMTRDGQVVAQDLAQALCKAGAAKITDGRLVNA